jgi:CubicO group peptidase (beta-lactamase class C family)
MAGQSAPPGAVIGFSRNGHRQVVVAGSTGPGGRPDQTDSRTTQAGAPATAVDRDTADLDQTSADHPTAPLDRSTAFDLASVSKIFLTCSLLRLIEEAQLSLMDELGQILPRAGWLRSLNLRQLLWHRAGLWEWQPLYLAPATARPQDGQPASYPYPLPASADPDRRARFTVQLAQLVQLPARYPHDQARHYSDLGFMLLGLVVEQVTGLSLSQALAQTVTGPWGLDRTGYGPITAAVAASAWGDTVERAMVASSQPYPPLFPDAGFAWREGLLAGQVSDGNCFHVFGQQAGHAGLFSTVDDLLSLAERLAAPGLTADQPVLASAFQPGPDLGQGLGWRLGRTRRADDREPVRFVYHPGFTGCAVGLWPDRGEAVVMLTNRLLATSPALTSRLWRRVLGAGGWEADLPLEPDAGTDSAPEPDPLRPTDRNRRSA